MQFEPLPPVPAVTLARRLRQIPLFRFVSVDELFRVSEIAQQVRYEPDATVQEGGSPAQYIQVLLEGAFEVRNAGDEKVMKPPTMLGFQEVLEGPTIQHEAHAQTDSVALVMPAEEFRTLLSANIELAQGLFRMLFDRSDGDGRPSQEDTSSPPQPPLLTESLKNVDKVLYLQTIPILTRATADELYELSAITREVELSPDKALFSEGHPSSIWLVLSGGLELRSPSDDGKSTAGAGTCIGIQETLAGRDWSWRGSASAAGKALQIERDALFELLADHMDLLQCIFGAIFESERQGRLAEAIAKSSAS